MYDKVYFEKNGPHFVGLSPQFHFKIHHKILWNTSILGKSILDFLSPNVKLHNPYCHSFHTWRRAAPLPQAKVIIVIDLFMAAARRSCGNLCMPFSAAYSRRAFFFFLFWHMIYACLQLGKVGRSISNHSLIFKVKGLAMNIQHDVFCSDVASRAIGPPLLFSS